jgi:hypothetical protein
VDQANAIFGQMPVPEGCAIPLSYTAIGIHASQYVNVSIHTGGGPCVDPPVKSLMNVNYQNTFISDVSGTSTSTNVSVAVEQGPHVAFPAVPPQDASFYALDILQTASFCATLYPQTFDVGSLTLTGPGIVGMTLSAQNTNGIISYQSSGVSLPPGTYTLNGTGGRTLLTGPFSATTQIPPPIRITTNLAPGTAVSPATSQANPSGITIHWTGGDSSSAVSAQFLSGGLTYAIVTVPATQGTLTYGFGLWTGPSILNPLFAFTFSPDDEQEIIVTQELATSSTFAVPGLTLGGQQTWEYVFDFRGLVLSQ